MSPAEFKRVKAVFAEAVEQSGPERQAFLDSACGGDAALRAEVEGLLSGLERAGEFFSAPTVDTPDRTSAMTLDPVPISEGPGARIGRYKLLQIIGEGGFGSVFMAEQEQPVRRRVALKIIKLGMDTKQVIARFEAERQALAMMDHAHIARVFDAGATDTGRPYFVMELVRGIPITEYCDSQNLNMRERLELFIPVCNAVQHAHQKGIIHRDIKPSNVMVTLADGKPVPKVIDFGIAKATNARLTEQTYFTEYRQFVGTPQYMSPEQAEMSGIDIDTRSDIYSLGVLLYELLTGTTPLDAKHLRSQAYEQMRQMIREADTPRPSTKISGMGHAATTVAQHRKTEPRKLEQLLRGELDWIVMRALEKDRTRRYDTPGNLASDIQRHLNNEPVLARPPSTLYAMRKFVSKHRFGMLAGTAVLTALVAGLALATVGFIRARSERDIADRARLEAQDQKRIAEDQRRLAAENERKAEDNAKQSNDNARKAELSLADGLISQADALSVAGRLAEAHQHYCDAYDRLAELKAPLAAAAAGLWSSYHQAFFPLMTMGHPGSGVMGGIAISPDGRTALSSFNRMLFLWDLPSGRMLRTFKGHTDSVLSVAISPDGRTALSGSMDKTMKLWDLATGKELKTFVGHSEVNCVAFGPDGQTARTGGYDGALTFWELATGKELRTFVGRPTGGTSILFRWEGLVARDGRTALSGITDRKLTLWDLDSGKELRTFNGHRQSITKIAMAPDGRTALSGDMKGNLKLWDLASGSELRTLYGHDNEISSIAFSPDGKTAISGSTETLKLWDLDSGRVLRTFTGLPSNVTFAPDGLTALSGAGGTLSLWSLTTGSGVRTLSSGNDWMQVVNSVAIAPDSRTALSGSADCTMKLWDLATGKALHTFTGHMGGVSSVAFAPDGKTALSASFDRTLKLWDLTSGRVVHTLTGDINAGVTVAITPDGRTAVSGSSDKSLTLWDLGSGKELRTLPGPDGDRVLDATFSIAIAPDGRTALCGGQELKLWDLVGSRQPRVLTRGNGGFICAAISPDGRSALAGGASGNPALSLSLLDLATGKEIRVFNGHASNVDRVAIASDGRTALSASSDKTLKLWDLESGKELRTFTGHTGALQSMAVAPDGRTVVSSDADGTLMLWDFSRGTAQRALEPGVAAAQATLQDAPNDPAALATLGEWYAFRGMDAWAVDFLTRAREGGAGISPLTLARCYWNLKRNADARREFQTALDQSKGAAERTYLGWCIRSIDSESAAIKPPNPNRKQGSRSRES